MADDSKNSHPTAVNRALPNKGDEHKASHSDALALPSHVAGSGTLNRLIATARDYAKVSTAENTNKAYASDWTYFLGNIAPILVIPLVTAFYLPFYRRLNIRT
ncbi:hypothetical protein LCGC14_2549270, partial [marine sediment metagenome]